MRGEKRGEATESGQVFALHDGGRQNIAALLLMNGAAGIAATAEGPLRWVPAVLQFDGVTKSRDALALTGSVEPHQSNTVAVCLVRPSVRVRAAGLPVPPLEDVELPGLPWDVA